MYVFSHPRHNQVGHDQRDKIGFSPVDVFTSAAAASFAAVVHVYVYNYNFTVTEGILCVFLRFVNLMNVPRKKSSPCTEIPQT